MRARQTLVLAGFIGLAGLAFAQQPAPTGPAPAAPAAPATPAPAVPPQPPAPAPPGQAAPAPALTPPAGAAELPTLAPGRTDPSGADEVLLVARPAAILRGEMPWDENLVKLRAVFGRIDAAIAKAGVKPAGRPVVIFLESDDVKFKYEALVPLAEVTDPKLTFGDDVVLGRTPEGKAIRFTHKGSYDEIDGTYEVVTAYLDAKGIEVKDPIIEEYLVEGLASDDANMELHIYVQPK